MLRRLKFEDKKAQSLVSWAIKRPRPPRTLWLPLAYRSEALSEICVAPGERVCAGQKIALPLLPGSIARHAPLSGTVERVHAGLPGAPDGGPLVEIRVDEIQEPAAYAPAARGWEEDPFSFFRDMGLVDLNADMEPLHLKVASARAGGAEVLAVNGCDPEPYGTCHYSLGMSHPLEILKGAEILRRAAGAERFVIFFQKSQMDAVELVRSKIYFLRWEHAEVRVLPDGYPQGIDALVLWDVLKTGARGFEAVKNRGLVLNLSTAFAVYEAAEYGKPLLERAVTVGGECVVEARNVWVPLGTRLEEAFRFCGGLLRQPGRVLLNGPLTGSEASSLSLPVLAGTRALLALAKEVFTPAETLSCDRCARCVDICPSEISPAEIAASAQKEHWPAAQSAGAGLCIECAACAAACPSRIPLLELVRSAKSALGAGPRRPATGSPRRRVLAGFAQ